MIIVCPKCGKEAERFQTRYGIRNSCCDLWSWGPAPLADKETHEARKIAHIYFDPLWRNKTFTRTKAYGILSNMLKLPIEKCHMKIMDKETAQRVPEVIRKIKEQYKL